MPTALIAAGVCLWAGIVLLVDSRKPRRSLSDRLRRFKPQEVADEAERWLRNRQTF